MKGFESLGDNCEFGLVQRFSGAEPLGLLRFSYSTIDALTHALDTDFRHYGADGDLELHQDRSGVTYCRSRRYGFPYILSESPILENQAEVLQQQRRKLDYLKRRFLDDLAGAEKILVRKGHPGEGPEETGRLMRALSRHGRPILLRVCTTEAGQAPGAVSWIGERLMQGHVRHFAPYERAGEIDLPGWLDLCRNAQALAQGRPAARTGPRRRANLVPLLMRRPACHRLGRGKAVPEAAQDGLEVFGRERTTKDLDTAAVHVFSAWIWIPRDFTGTEVTPAIGHLRLKWRYPDPALRDAWQHVWVSAVIPATFRRIVVGLVVAGPEGDRIWSAGWRFEENPAPTETAPPRHRPG